MIEIDRSSATPVHEQLVEQLRFLIAGGHFKVDEMLPSTRALAAQVGVSFHTVRKAYQQLEAEGLLTSRTGSGYKVVERAPLSKSERIERGASVMQEALQRLIALGLTEAEAEYLFHEQIEQLASERTGLHVLFAAPYREMAELCSEQIAQTLQQRIQPVLLHELEQHQDADYVLARFSDVQPARKALPRVDVLGVITYLSPESLESIARLLPQETLGVITRHADAIQPLTAEIRAHTGFAGQTIAASIDESARHLHQFVDQTDLLAFTPSCRRRLLPFLTPERKYTVIRPIVSRDSLERVLQNLPG